MEVCRGQVTSWDDNEIAAWEVRPTSRSDGREARSCSGRRPEFRARTGSGPPRAFLQPPGSSSAGPLTPTAIPPSSPLPAPLRRLRPPSQQLPQAKAEGEAPTSPSRPRRPRPLGPTRPARPARPDDPRPSPRCRSNPCPLATTPRAHPESTPHTSGCSKCISWASVGPAGIPAKNPARADFLPLPLLHATPHLLHRPWFWKWGPLSLEGHLAIWSDQGVWCVYTCPQLFRYHSLERQDPHPTSNLGVQAFSSQLSRTSGCASTKLPECAVIQLHGRSGDSGDIVPDTTSSLDAKRPQTPGQRFQKRLPVLQEGTGFLFGAS